MFNPIAAVLSLQTAMFDSWLKAYGATAECWRQMFLLQQTLLKDLPYHRCNTILPTGASFLDGYGRRCHDIDPERDV